MSGESYLLHPRAPLVFGTGRPTDFGIAGSSLSFPFPSTIAGAMRAAHEVKHGRAANPFSVGKVDLEWVSLARFDYLNDAKGFELLVPRPADSVSLNGKLFRLAPQTVPDQAVCDLPAGLQVPAIADAKQEELKGKPDEQSAWWTAARMSSWLADPAAACKQQGAPCDDTLPDTRAHVVMQLQGKGAKEGQLFRTTGRDFAPRKGSSTGLALLARVSRKAGEAASLHGEVRRVGGEGRFVRIEAAGSPGLPMCPGLSRARIARFVLLTPALFEKHGWYPDFMQQILDSAGTTHIEGKLSPPGKQPVVLRIVAAAISRAQSYSGWQARRDDSGSQVAGPGQPWRVVPAGSVYWFEVLSGNAADLWMQSLCVDRWRQDGWGVGMVGVA